jgi:hypothetical protein
VFRLSRHFSLACLVICLYTWRYLLPKKTRLLTIRLTEKEHEALKEYATVTDFTMSEIMREFIDSVQKKLKRLKGTDAQGEG